MNRQQLIELVSGKPAAAGSPPEYTLRGEALAGGFYNSHLVACVLLAGLVAIDWVNLWLAVWLAACLAAALLLDGRAWRRKIALRAMPGQLFLYLQVLAWAVLDALPFYILAFFLYVGVAPYWRPYDLAVSSFVMLYAFYMVVRLY